MPQRVAIVVARWNEPDSGNLGARDTAVREAVATLVKASDQVTVKALSFTDPLRADNFSDGVENAIVEKLNEFGEASRDARQG
jgi:hypothetical protein